MSLLARPSGSIVQFMLASLPLLAVMLYMLYAASIRPDHAAYNIPNNVMNDDEALRSYEEANAVFPLYDMIWVFLSFFVVWCMLLVYIVIFVPKRRALMERYLNEGTHVLGDVYTKPHRKLPCRFTDYGYVRYKHPEAEGMIVKKVRVFQMFSREQVTILRLPDKPFSGQPSSDVEMDVASFSDSGSHSRDRTRPLVWFILAWALFTLLSPLYIIHQMGKVEDVDDYESTSRGWRAYWIMAGIVMPIVAIGYNWIRWLFHVHYVVNRGWVVPESTDVAASISDVSSYGAENLNMSQAEQAETSNKSEYRLFPDKRDNAVYKA